MKRTVYVCDLCQTEITATPPFILSGKSEGLKQIGRTIALTGKGDRLLVGKAVIRISASFYCGELPETEELHFHSDCIEEEVHRRILEAL